MLHRKQNFYFNDGGVDDNDDENFKEIENDVTTRKIRYIDIYLL